MAVNAPYRYRPSTGSISGQSNRARCHKQQVATNRRVTKPAHRHNLRQNTGHDAGRPPLRLVSRHRSLRLVDGQFRKDAATYARHIRSAPAGTPDEKRSTPAARPARPPASGQIDRHRWRGRRSYRSRWPQLCPLRAKPQEITIADHHRAHNFQWHNRNRAGQQAYDRANASHRPTKDRHALKVADR